MNDQELERLLKNTKPQTDKEVEAKHKDAALKAFRQSQSQQPQVTSPNRFYRHSWYGAIAASVFLVTGIFLFGAISPKLHIDRPESINVEEAEINPVESYEKTQQQEFTEPAKVAPIPVNNSVDLSEMQESKRSLSQPRIAEKREADLFSAPSPSPERSSELEKAAQAVSPMSAGAINSNSEFIWTATQPSLTIPLDANNKAFKYIQKNILQGKWPNLEHIQEEQFINAFNLELIDDPTNDQPITITSVIENTPWQNESRLLFVFISYDDSSEPAGGEITFAASIVQGYKLLAYSKSTAPKGNAGSLTLAFELKPTSTLLDRSTILHNAARVNLQLKDASQNQNILIEKSIPDRALRTIVISSDLDFLTAIIGFKELLKNPDKTDGWSFSNAIDLAAKSYKNNPSAEKEAYYQLFKKAQSLQLGASR